MLLSLKKREGPGVAGEPLHLRGEGGIVGADLVGGADRETAAREAELVRVSDAGAAVVRPGRQLAREGRRAAGGRAASGARGRPAAGSGGGAGGEGADVEDRRDHLAERVAVGPDLRRSGCR